MLKVLRCSASSPTIYQKALLTSELRVMTQPFRVLTMQQIPVRITANMTITPIEVIGGGAGLVTKKPETGITIDTVVLDSKDHIYVNVNEGKLFGFSIAARTLSKKAKSSNVDLLRFQRR